jgi:hypothetical protein
VARLRHDQKTQDYLARRIREGKSKKEAIRWLTGCANRRLRDEAGAPFPPVG